MVLKYNHGREEKEMAVDFTEKAKRYQAIDEIIASGRKLKWNQIISELNEVYDIKKQAAKRSYQGLETIIKALETAKVRISANVNFDLVIELLLLTIKEN